MDDNVRDEGRVLAVSLGECPDCAHYQLDTAIFTDIDLIGHESDRTQIRLDTVPIGHRLDRTYSVALEHGFDFIFRT